MKNNVDIKQSVIIALAAIIFSGCVGADNTNHALENAIAYRDGIEEIYILIDSDNIEYDLASKKHIYENGRLNDNFYFEFSDGTRFPESIDKYIDMVNLIVIPDELKYTRKYFLASLEHQKILNQYIFDVLEMNIIKKEYLKSIELSGKSASRAWKRGEDEIDRIINDLDK